MTLAAFFDIQENESTNRGRFHAVDILLVCTVVILSIVEMRGFGARMAMLHCDDGPIFYALAYRDPELFAGDYHIGQPIDAYARKLASLSALHFIPALLWTHADVDPYVSTWFLTCLQGVGIGVSFYVLTLTVTGSRLSALIACIFAYAAAPWSWCLAHYGNAQPFHFLPYGANLAYTPILLAFTALLRGRWLLALTLLLMGGLIHPLVALYAATGIFFFWILERPRSSRRLLLGRIVMLSLVVAAFMARSLFVAMEASESSELVRDAMAALTTNNHIWPLRAPELWLPIVFCVFGWMALGIVASRYARDWSGGMLRLWIASILAGVIFASTTLIGYWANIPFLMKLVGFRGFSWSVMLALPLIAHYWRRRLSEGGFWARVAVALMLLFPLFKPSLGLLWPMVVVLMLGDLADGWFGARHMAQSNRNKLLARFGAIVGVLSWCVVWCALPSTRSISGGRMDVFVDCTWGSMLASHQYRILTLATIFAFAMSMSALGQGNSVILATRFRWVPVRVATCLILMMAMVYAALVIQSRRMGVRQSRTSEVTQLMDVQRWARTSTGPDTRFLVPVSNGWRTSARRKLLYPFTVEQTAYVHTEAGRAYRERLLKHYGISAEFARMHRGMEIRNFESQTFYSFSQAQLRGMAAEFGATHMVLPRTERSERLKLPREYENEKYLVFRFEESRTD